MIWAWHNKEIVSIRAPAKGATQPLQAGRKLGRVSIRAPAKGATLASDDEAATRVSFDPRSREGSDTFFWIIFASIKSFRSALPRRERHSHLLAHKSLT